MAIELVGLLDLGGLARCISSAKKKAPNNRIGETAGGSTLTIGTTIFT
jgi:hypothetical protein